jgi:hypothetical protein
MKIDLKEIINIKNKKQLEKFKLDKPIEFSNYLFHYLIIFNKLDILQLENFPIYKENDDGLNGFFLAAKKNNIPILKYLLNAYPDYIYNTNEIGDMFINFLEPKNILKILNKKLDLELLLKHRISPENNKDIVLDSILLNCNFNELQKLFNLYKPKKYPLNYLFINDKLNEKEIIILLKQFDSSIYDLRDQNDMNLIFSAIEKNSKILLEFLLNYEITVDYYTIIYTSHPLRIAFSNKNMDLYSIIWNKIKKKYNYELTNRFLENIAHHLLKFNAIDPISFEILSECPSSVWHQVNIYKLTPLDFLVKLNFETYSKILINKEIDLNINKIDEKLKEDKNDNSFKWLIFLKSLKKYNDNNQVILDEYKYTYGNLFQSKFKDISMIIIYLTEKYKNLYLPNLDDYSLKNLNYSENLGLSWPDSILDRTPIFPWIICYDDENNFWIHTILNNLINSQRRFKLYDFTFAYLSLSVPDVGLHANIIIYDFNNMTVERFDPYGDTVYFDKYLDTVLEEELTWNTGLTYLKPSDYMPISGFQTVSDELNPYNQKSGDYGGYCLAWCTWYLEHRLKNKNIKPKILIDKLLKKMSKLNISFIEYIRNYANKLNTERVKNFMKAGLDEKQISNTNTDLKTNRILNKYIIELFTSYNK